MTVPRYSKAPKSATTGFFFLACDLLDRRPYPVGRIGAAEREYVIGERKAVLKINCCTKNVESVCQLAVFVVRKMAKVGFLCMEEVREK